MKKKKLIKTQNELIEQLIIEVKKMNKPPIYEPIDKSVPLIKPRIVLEA